MIALRKGRALIGLIGAGMLVLLQSVGASAVTSDLINTNPTSVAIDAPAPGETQTWKMSVSNAADSALPLGLEITGSSDVLFSGATPMEISVKTLDGGTVVERVPVGKMLGKSLQLPELQVGKTYDLVGSVTLPREAGNSYQGASGNLKFRFVTSLDKPDVNPAPPYSGPNLANTGMNNLLPITIAAVALLVIGLGVVVLRRKSSSHE
ncbi:MAG TPA: LPXTG cell wall anchor domain-containing protein [Arthrobacter sp.]|nr:LPXTG cell wall anchor domain-containing protein [Arthrobacter sp.]